MLEAGGGAESSPVTRVSCGWNKFTELLLLLPTKAISLKVRGVMLYGCETWPVNGEDTQRDTQKRDVNDSLDVWCIMKRETHLGRI